MKKRRLLLAGILAATGVLATALVSGSAASPGQTAPLIRIAVNTPVTLLDQAHEAGGYGPSVSLLGLETLMKFGKDGSIQPNLASKVVHPNPFTYIYTVRPGVKFWDGAPLTAVDIANALNYYRFPGTQTAHYYSGVRDVRAKGNQVFVTLKTKDVSWETTSAFATMIFEKRFGDAHKGTMGRPGVGIMGTGPWILQSFDPTRGIEFTANPRYWGGKAPIQRVSIKTISDTTAQALAFRTGQIDFVPAVIDVRGFESAAGSKTASVPSCGQSNMSFNTGIAPWNDVHVRRAVAYAMNRADIIKASGSPGVPLEMVIPPTLLRTLGTQAQVNALIKSLPLHPYNLTKAKQEMALSKYPNGFTATLSSYAYGGSLQEMQVLAAQLAKIGIKLDLDNIGLSAVLAKWFGPREKLGLEYVAGWGCNPDVAFLPNLLLPSKDARAGALNLANYKNATVDSLLQQGKQVSNKTKRLEIYGKLLRQLAIDVPYLAVYSPTQNFAISDKFTWKDATGFWFGTSDWLLGVKPK